MEDRIITREDLQTIVSTRIFYLVSIEKGEQSIRLFLAYANPEETKYKIRLSVLYSKVEVPLYLCVIEIRGVSEVLENIPVEFVYPSVADITVSDERLRISTCDGDGYIDLRLDRPEFRWKDYNRVIGVVRVERFLFVYGENVLIERA